MGTTEKIIELINKQGRKCYIDRGILWIEALSVEEMERATPKIKKMLTKMDYNKSWGIKIAREDQNNADK